MRKQEALGTMRSDNECRWIEVFKDRDEQHRMLLTIHRQTEIYTSLVNRSLLCCPTSVMFGGEWFVNMRLWVSMTETSTIGRLTFGLRVKIRISSGKRSFPVMPPPLLPGTTTPSISKDKQPCLAASTWIEHLTSTPLVKRAARAVIYITSSHLFAPLHPPITNSDWLLAYIYMPSREVHLRRQQRVRKKEQRLIHFFTPTHSDVREDKLAKMSDGKEALRRLSRSSLIHRVATAVAVWGQTRQNPPVV